MARREIEINYKQQSGYDQLMPDTVATIVEINHNNNDLTADNVQGALDELNITAKNIINVYSDAIVLKSDFVADTTYEEYPFIATINMPNATDKLYAYVNFGLAESISGNYAPVVKTGSGKIYIYAKEIPESDITIPTVLLYNANEQDAPPPPTYLTFNVEITKTASVELGGIVATLYKGNNSENQTLLTDGRCKFSVGWGDGEYKIKFSNIPKGYVIAPITQSGVKDGEYNVSSKIKLTKIMTVKIDESDSNPETCVTYHADAVDMTPKSPEWDEFFGHKPCLFKDGKVVGYLNPNDFTKFENGSPADITSGNAGDVMIEFPRRNWVIFKTGSIVTMSITDDLDKFDESFDCIAHKRGQVMKDAMYIGAYKGSELNGKLRSLSGKTPASDKTIGQFRDLAHANGVGYEQSTFYPLTYRQMMYIMKYKNLNSQKALGMGNVGSSLKATGNTNTKGMDWGSTSSAEQMKLFGIEDYWGNIWEWIDGLYNDGSRHIKTANDNFNDTGNGYFDNGVGSSSNINGYTTKIQGGTKTGFVQQSPNGSDSTYYTDFGYLGSSCVASFGGLWLNGSNAGAFRLVVSVSPSISDSGIGARLSFV